MATYAHDSTHSGWNPPPNNTNYIFKFPRAHCGNSQNGNNDSKENISEITPRITQGGHENEAYDMPPEYGNGNNDSKGNISEITPRITRGRPDMATDSTHSGWNPPLNNTNYNYFKFPRAHCGNSKNGNNDSKGNIFVITPRITRRGQENEAYDMPPEYGNGNNDSKGNISEITSRITRGRPDNSTDSTHNGLNPPPNNTNYNYSQYPPAQYGYYENGNNDSKAVITPRITRGGYENQTYAIPPPVYGNGNNDGKGNISMITLGRPEADTPPPDYTQGLEDILEENCFSDATIRRGFVRKVFLTLTIQLLITVGIICAFLYWNDLKIWTQNNYWFTVAMMPATLVIVLVLACCGDIRRKVPVNYILLGLFTIAEGLMLGSVTVFFNAEAVLWAIGATAFVCFTLILFTVQTKWRFTGCNSFLWVLLWSLISFGILCAILRSQYIYIVYAGLATMLFSVYLVVDIQLMLGRDYKYSISPEEYIFAALNLYLDILLMFLYILQAFGQSQS